MKCPGLCCSANQDSTSGVLGAALGPPQPTHLKHLLDVGVLGLQQLSPGGEVAVGEDPAGLQQAEGMVLRHSGGGVRGAGLSPPGPSPGAVPTAVP